MPSCLSLCYSAAENACPVWIRSTQTEPGPTRLMSNHIGLPQTSELGQCTPTVVGQVSKMIVHFVRKHQIWHISRLSYYELIWILGHLKFSPLWLWQPFKKKWPTAVTDMMHICFAGEECRLTVRGYLLIKVQ